MLGLFHCKAGRSATLSSARENRMVRPLCNHGHARGFQLWHATMPSGRLPDPVLPPCLPVAARPAALHPQRACHRALSAFWLGGFGALANQNGRQKVPRCRPGILVRKIGNGPPRAGRPANLQRAVHERRHHIVRRAPNEGPTLLRRPALRLLFPPFLIGLPTAHLIVLCMQSIFGMGTTTRGRC